MVSVTLITPSARQADYMVLSGRNYYPVTIQATVTETNPALSMVGATLDWNDGSQPVSFGPDKPLAVSSVRNLAIGTYFVTLKAFNYAAPTRQEVNTYFSIQVDPPVMVPVPNDFLFGPILPMDTGYPNAQEWNFNVGTNLDVLKSSVKMLLLTTKGERVMQPTYGTYLRRAIFEPSTGAVSSVIQDEIAEALNQFEPRVSLESWVVERLANQRSVVITATFMSKINQSTFSITIPVSQ